MTNNNTKLTKLTNDYESNTNIYTVVDQWIDNSDASIFINPSSNPYFGHISDWDTSLVTDMSSLFINKSTSLLDFLALYSARIGIKAWVNAPSAEILLNKFGILNATKKASLSKPAPKILAITVSLIKPRILDKVVIPLTLASVLDIFIKDYSIR